MNSFFFQLKHCIGSHDVFFSVLSSMDISVENKSFIYCKKFYSQSLSLDV